MTTTTTTYTTASAPSTFTTTTVSAPQVVSETFTTTTTTTTTSSSATEVPATTQLFLNDLPSESSNATSSLSYIVSLIFVLAAVALSGKYGYEAY